MPPFFVLNLAGRVLKPVRNKILFLDKFDHPSVDAQKIHAFSQIRHIYLLAYNMFDSLSICTNHLDIGIFIQTRHIDGAFYWIWVHLDCRRN